MGARRPGRVRAARLAAALLAAMGSPATGGAEPPRQYRSVTDLRPRISDAPARPYSRETQSHRGWEIRERQFTVFASTSQHDARRAARQVQAAWNEAATLADRWTTMHRQSDFGLSSLQVVIDSEPVRERAAPPATLSVVGGQTQLAINVSAGQPPLDEQVVLLREGAAFAMLHAAGLDAAVPPWVMQGIAAYVGRQGLDQARLAAADGAFDNVQLGGQAWRQVGAASGRLNKTELGGAAFADREAADRVAFLLTGDDAQYAPLLVAAVQEATAAAASVAVQARGNAFSLRRPPKSTARPEFDRLITERQPQYAAWKADPFGGQPLFEPAANEPAELQAFQREMLVVLKLARRQTPKPSGVRSKIAAFDRDQRQAVEAPQTIKRDLSMSELAARLTDPQEPVWGTMDADGRLLLSTDYERVQRLLGQEEGRYRWHHDGQRNVLVRRLADGRALRGWLEENPQNPARPRAKFETGQRK
jgi:hypothetical protein